MRGRRAFVVLTGYVSVLSLIIGLFYFALTRAAPPQMVNQAGAILTPALIYVQLGLICLTAPTFSASAISSEREQQTLDLLVISLARPSTILFGKVGAALSYLLLTLFGSLPLVSLTYALGGVSLRDIAIAYLVMLVAGMTFCSVSFYWSTLIRRSVLAQLVSILTVIVLVVGIPGLAAFFSALAFRISGTGQTYMNIIFLLLRTNPFAAVAGMIPGFKIPSGVWMQGVPIWVSQIAFYSVLTTVSLLLALRRLDRVRKWL
jgi:ABC-type transport system involved in multi-copper enzyme maturation permease subunit